MKDRKYILYDGRALNGDTWDATVLMSCASLKEAHEWKGEFGDASVCYSYKVQGKTLVDKKWEFDYIKEKP